MSNSFRYTGQDKVAHTPTDYSKYYADKSRSYMNRALDASTLSQSSARRSIIGVTTVEQYRDDIFMARGETITARDTAVAVSGEVETFRDETRTDRQAAQTARTGAETAETNAKTHAADAASSASSAADILTDAESLGLTVDTSVGTRVYVGNTMIHGDTGWRDVSDRLPSGIVRSSSTNANLPPIIRRVGPTVSLEIYADILEGEIRNLLQGLPFGYRPNQTISRPGTLYISTHVGAILPGTIHSHYISGSGGVSTAQPLPSPGTAMLTASWQTSDPWPTSLPGTPV